MPDLNLREPEFLRSLERLSLISRRAYAGSLKGEKRSTRRGTSIEFADYRDYVPGDDLRYLDWNAYGRLDKLLLKLFVEEEDLRVYLLVNRSKSMSFGEPVKFDYARQLAAALAYIALSGLDRVTLASFGGELDPGLRPLRGKGNVLRIFDALEQMTAEGGTEFGRSLARFAAEHRTPGLCIVVSDFLSPTGYEHGLNALLARKFDIVALQVLAPEELNPAVVGDLKLLDSETGEAREITVSDSLLRRYRSRAADYCEQLRKFCSGRGMHYLQAVTNEPVTDVVADSLRRLGLVK